MTAVKPYQQIPIHDCGERLVPIPLAQFAVVTPHPYQVLGAPYGDRSPYWLRQSVLEALRQAQQHLQQDYPGWRIQIFDAYRPIAVQQFMVEHTFQQLLAQRGWKSDALDADQAQAVWQAVYQFWAPPSHDPAMPPPHSTGAAVDVTLVDAQQAPVQMGSPIDEVSARSHPDYFAQFSEPEPQRYHAHRLRLRHYLEAAGFRQHPNEWWHFSLGDQLWAWQQQSESAGSLPVARYGLAA